MNLYQKYVVLSLVKNTQYAIFQSTMSKALQTLKIVLKCKQCHRWLVYIDTMEKEPFKYYVV